MYQTLEGLVIDLFYILCIHVLSFFLLRYLKKKDNKLVTHFITLLLIMIPLFYAYRFYDTKRMMGTVVLGLVINTVVLVFGVRFMGFLKLQFVDYALMFLILSITQFGLRIVRLDTNLTFALILSSLLVIVLVREGTLKGNVVSIVLSFAGASFNIIVFSPIFNFFKWNLYYRISRNQGFGNFEKIILLGIVGAAFLLISALVIFIIKRIFHSTFHNLGTLSERYGDIERYFILMLVILILVLLLSGQIPLVFIYDDVASGYQHVVNLLIFVIIGMQVIYLNVLLRTIRLKENLEIKEETQQNLILYSSNLEKNMKNIRGLKHDMKNLLLTMGEYVEQSGNEKMKEFYNEQILLATDHEIKMNDIYIDLQMIRNEPFRAFLYYKLVQGFNVGVDMQLELSEMSEVFEGNIDFADIIRILGIFLDNAIEEAAESKDADVFIKIQETDSQASFIIKNTIQEGTKEKGISQGTTTKGLGRGNGLVIADEIIHKYKNIVLNSYFNDELFVQNLTVFK